MGLLQPPVMSRRLEFLDRVELQRFANPLSENRPDARDRLEQGFRAGAPLQVLEEAPPAGREHFRDCAGDCRADARNRFQRFAPAPVGDSADIIVQHTD